MSFFSGQKPVKFSAEPDLSSDVCERLLAKYIPASIQSTKTSQQLFLRCVLSKMFWIVLQGIFIGSALSLCCKLHTLPFYLSHNIHSRYMKRRCWFLDNLPAYNFNSGGGTGEGKGEVTDTTHLGSTLMATMIREAEQFCHPCIEEGRDYHQVTKHLEMSYIAYFKFILPKSLSHLDLKISVA